MDLPDASSSSHPFISSVPSCVVFELLKTAHVITHPLPAPSHPSHPVISSIQSPRLSPRPSTWVAGRFLFACRLAGRCGSVVLAVYRAVASRRLARLVAIVSGSACLACRPRFSRVSCLLLSRRHAVGGEVGGSSPLAPPCDTGSEERGAIGVGACGGDGALVSARCGIITPRSRRGDMLLALCPVSSCPPVLVPCRIDWRGRLLKNGGGRLPVSFVAMWSSFRLCRCLPNPPSFAYLVRFPYVSAFRLGISPRQSVSPRPSCRIKRGARRGGICPVLDLPHPIQSCCLFKFQFLALPPLARSCRFACLNWSPAPGRGRRGRLGRFAAAGVQVACLRSHFLVPLSRSSLVRYCCRVRFPLDGII